MKRKLFRCAVVFAICLTSVAGRADTILLGAPNPTSSPSPALVSVNNYAAQGFHLDASQGITSLQIGLSDIQDVTSLFIAQAGSGTLLGNTVWSASPIQPTGTSNPLDDSFYSNLISVNQTLGPGDYFLVAEVITGPSSPYWLYSNSALVNPNGDAVLGSYTSDNQGLTWSGSSTALQFQLNTAEATVPEPGSLALFASGLFGGASALRKYLRK